MINGITLRILAASIFHTRLECEISMKALDELEITLYRIYEEPISIEEMVFGIIVEEGIFLLNWLTFILRQTISGTDREF